MSESADQSSKNPSDAHRSLEKSHQEDDIVKSSKHETSAASSSKLQDGKNIEEELAAATKCIEKGKQQLKYRERQFIKWEKNFNKEIPELIEAAVKKRVESEIEKKMMEIQESHLQDENKDAFDGKERKIRKTQDIEDREERMMLRKVIDDCIKAEKKQKAKEDEIKFKYQHLIQAEVTTALFKERCTNQDSSSSGSDVDPDSDENARRTRKKHVSKQQYRDYLGNNPSSSRNIRYPDDGGFCDYARVNHSNRGRGYKKYA